MKSYAAWFLFAALFTPSVTFASETTEATEWRYESDTLNITITKDEESYAVAYTEIDPRGKIAQRHLGEGFSCSEGLFGDGSRPELTIISCEKALNETNFLLVNILPNKKDFSFSEAEIELYDSSLGSQMYRTLGQNFTRVPKLDR